MNLTERLIGQGCLVYSLNDSGNILTHLGLMKRKEGPSQEITLSSSNSESSHGTNAFSARAPFGSHKLSNLNDRVKRGISGMTRIMFFCVLKSSLYLTSLAKSHPSPINFYTHCLNCTRGFLFLTGFITCFVVVVVIPDLCAFYLKSCRF